MVQIEIILKGKPYPEVFKLWDKLMGYFWQAYSDENVVDGFTGREICFTGVSQYLLKNKSDSFCIEIKKGSVEFSYVSDFDLSRLDIKKIATSKEVAERLVSELVDDPAFIQARLYDEEYDRWQNMEDIAYYESEGRDHSGLPKKSNGLPFPLERVIIDITGNSGRWELKKGYVESIGSTMWVDKSLANDLGSNISVADSDDGFSVSDLGHVLKIEVQEECFKSATGDEAEIQDRLRKKLYNK